MAPATPISATVDLAGTGAPPRWSLAHRVLFRFVCCYLVLYSTASVGLSTPWHAICPWIAIHVFGLSGMPTTYFLTGSGDTTLAYIEALLFLVISLPLTLVWSLADRKRPNYRRLHAWLRLLIRYVLALTLLSYGFAKVVPQQFQPPRLMKFIQPYGEFSPMGVLWNFMGASLAYTVFSGAAEVLGGLLLLFRRTATLGALVSIAVLANVVALNFCYDVPVKLYSTNLLLMSVFLAAPDLRRLFQVLVLNRAVGPADPMAVRFERRGLRIAALVLWIAFAGAAIVGHTLQAISAYRRLYAAPQRPSLYGVYEVESFRQNGKDLVLADDAMRWRKVVFDERAMGVRTMDDRVVMYPGKYDQANRAFNVDQLTQVSWSQPDPEHLAIACNCGGMEISARLRKLDMQTFRLVNRGFHWISETPFNR